MDAWLLLTRDNLVYRSPSLRPELFRIIGQFNPKVFVGFEEGRDGPSLFFPFARPTRWASFASSILMCDYQAFIASVDHPIAVSHLMQRWKLSTWTFDNLIAPPEVVSQTTTHVSSVSPRAVLHDGFAGYLAEMTGSGKSMRNTTAKLRLLGRDHGEVRFVSDCKDDAVLATLLDWKAQKFNRGHAIAPWIQNALYALYGTRTVGFSGMLSALYAGERLVAAHFGIRSDGTLYYWFPAFNPEFGRYTPGWLLIYFLLQHLEATGCNVLDFGPGGEQYKEYFKNSVIPVHSGFVELPSILNLGRATWRSVDRAVRGSRTARFFLRPVSHMLRRRAAR
jgi:CelD/BcsL family acetyltransferase involved in cellulose biosynthesis